ncbi:ankyrin repeat domain-containing protein [Streptomyces sp. H27-H1]|uniref:ankyrin repeat domain-containing protein n=1 Tax=Streptomyces sp. H27-H1 TaxID=2996461 RepID=UPI002D1E49EC|nr:ankyrin repeat domain-containing protein [Streptomyces sp. H27-H1]
MVSEDGQAPLVLAATVGIEGFPETVDLLLDRGADVNAVMKRGAGVGALPGFDGDGLAGPQGEGGEGVSP